MRHSERHRSERIGWLRAAVLGANDGIVSTASLVLGVAAAHATHGNVMIAGIAGLVAGAMSMAAGEYVSVRSQADSEEAALELGARILRLGRPVAPMIPDDDGARAVVVLRDHALELGVLEGVILDLHGQALDLRPD